MPDRKDYHPAASVCHKPGTHQGFLSERNLTIHDFRGLTNLLLIIFFATNAREIMANIMKYGILVTWIPSTRFIRENAVALAGILMLIGIAFCAYWIERTRTQHFATSLRLIRSQEKLAVDLVIETPKVEGSKVVSSSLRRRVTGDGQRLGKKDSQPQSKSSDETKAGEGSPRTISSPMSPQEPLRTAPSPGPPTLSRKASIASISGIEDLGAKQFVAKVTDLLNDQRVIEEAAEHLHVVLVTLVAVLMIVLPYFLISYTDIEPASSLAILFTSATWCLKLTSFHHVLHDVRAIKVKKIDFTKICSSEDERRALEKYPESFLGVRDFGLYMAYPTLCFQLHYPRKGGRDWAKLGQCLGMILLCIVAIKILVEQYMVVIVQSTFTVIDEDFTLMKLLGHFIERMLKLSLPTLYVWLLVFLAFFHYWLTFLAELTRFTDTNFYEDWWNATGFGDYWRKWNLPVHNFCTRHIYKPLLNLGVSKFIAGQAVFVLSALGHEYLVVAPLRIGWTGLVFTAFVMQTPLAIITDAHMSKRHPTWGNMLFWVVFCFTGQPLAVMVFYYLWNVNQGAFSALTAESLRNLVLV